MDFTTTNCLHPTTAYTDPPATPALSIVWSASSSISTGWTISDPSQFVLTPAAPPDPAILTQATFMFSGPSTTLLQYNIADPSTINATTYINKYYMIFDSTYSF